MQNLTIQQGKKREGGERKGGERRGGERRGKRKGREGREASSDLMNC